MADDIDTTMAVTGATLSVAGVAGSTDASALSRPAKKKRTAKDLPPLLATLTDKDKSLFVLAEETDPNPKSPTYGKDHLCAQSVKLKDDKGNEVSFCIPKDLNLDQLRKLCANVGVTNAGSSSKYKCRQAIASLIRYEQQLQGKGLAPGSHGARTSNSLCRVINVVFGPDFVDRFVTLNDKRDRQDHETKQLCRDFWKEACMAYNDFDPGDADEDYKTTIITYGDDHLEEYEFDDDTNLNSANNIEENTMKKKVYALFACRRQMKKDMTQSGTHDNDPWSYVENGMKATSGLTKIAAYYFYKRCEERPEIDAAFQPFMDPDLKGGSESLGTVSPVSPMSETSSSRKSAKKQKALAYDAIQDMAKHAECVAKEVSRGNDLREAELEARKKKEALDTKIKIAVALNDMDVLRELRHEMEEHN